jgi:hypothetical protein
MNDPRRRRSSAVSSDGDAFVSRGRLKDERRVPDARLVDVVGVEATLATALVSTSDSLLYIDIDPVHDKIDTRAVGALARFRAPLPTPEVPVENDA